MTENRWEFVGIKHDNVREIIEVKQMNQLMT